ncbi:hypothetical protein G2W53_028276 [Senna tora]|uniref:Uncharacterized protein n=1 Tax=Senna tora TaxID=362788 RepID=A0A834T5R4_9FABA|nr:hypothetical protein G2W53_028276 [Senna tora]
MISYLESLLLQPHSSNDDDSDRFCPVIMDINTVPSSYGYLREEEEEEEDGDSEEMLNQVRDQSMEEVYMVPGTEKAMELLEKVEVFNNGKDGLGRCSICLENCNDEGVSRMPCFPSAVPGDMYFTPITVAKPASLRTWPAYYIINNPVTQISVSDKSSQSRAENGSTDGFDCKMRFCNDGNRANGLFGGVGDANCCNGLPSCLVLTGVTLFISFNKLSKFIKGFLGFDKFPPKVFNSATRLSGKSGMDNFSKTMGLICKVSCNRMTLLQNFSIPTVKDQNLRNSILSPSSSILGDARLASAFSGFSLTGSRPPDSNVS